jgi:hypothetical protein
MDSNSEYLQHFNFLDNFTNINGYYTIPILAGITTFLNIFCLAIMLHKKFTEKYRFKYIINRLIIEITISLLTINFENALCINGCFFNTTLFNILYIIWAQVIIRFLYNLEGINEVYLAYDRYLILKNKKNLFNKNGSFKWIILLSSFVSLIISIPLGLSAYYKKINGTDMYSIVQTEIGNSLAYMYYYSIGFYFFVEIFLIILLIWATVLVVNEFKIYSNTRSNNLNLTNLPATSNNNDRKMKSAQKKNKRKKAQYDFTRVTVALNILYAITRLVKMTSLILLYIYGFTFSISLDYPVYSLNISYMLTLIVFCFNLPVLLSFNKKYSKTFKSIFGFRTEMA